MEEGRFLSEICPAGSQGSAFISVGFSPMLALPPAAPDLRTSASATLVEKSSSFPFTPEVLGPVWVMCTSLNQSLWDKTRSWVCPGAQQRLHTSWLLFICLRFPTVLKASQEFTEMCRDGREMWSGLVSWVGAGDAVVQEIIWSQMPRAQFRTCRWLALSAWANHFLFLSLFPHLYSRNNNRW